MRSVPQVLVLVAVAACASPLASAQTKPAGSPSAPAPSASAPSPATAAPRPAAVLPAAPAGSLSLLPPGAAPVLLAQAVPVPTGAAGAPAPAGAQGNDAAVVTAPPKPPPIDVEDPLLTPVPPAANQITGFREVLNLLSNESLTLRIAQQDIERAKGQERTAVAAMLPTINATGQTSTTPFQDFSCGPADATTCQFQRITQQRQASFSQGALSLTEILSARSFYAIGTASKSVEAAKLRAEDARRQAIAAAASAIVSVVSAERVAEINRVALRAALQRLELTKRRKRLGSGTDLDIVRAEQDAASSRSQIVSGDETLRKARESLGQLFGKSEAFGVPATFTLDDIEPALRSACKPAKADERTDVLAAKVDLEVAKRGVTDVKLGYLPTLQLSSNLATSSTDTESKTKVPVAPPALNPPITFPGVITETQTSVISQTRTSWSISALLTVPIWDGGARYGQTRTANANVEQAKTKLEQATVTATVEATQAQRSITVAEQARAVAEQARNLARETARLSQVAFESGAGTSLDLVDSGRVLRQAELDLAVKELEVVRARIAALLALSACNL